MPPTFNDMEGFEWLDWVVDKIAVKHGREKMAKIPKFASEQEESEFWDTHDFTDYMDDTTEVDIVFRDVRPRKNVIELRPDDETLARLRALAHSRGKGVQMQIMEWVQQHLASEAPAPPASAECGVRSADCG